MLLKRKWPQISSKWNSTGVKTSVSFLKPYNFFITCCGRSKRPYFRFSNRLPASLDVRSKSSYFFSQKWIKILSSTETLTNFYLVSSWQSLLTAIWFSRLKISHWFFIRWFCWTRDQTSMKPRIKKQQAFLKSAFFRKNKDNKYWQRLAK